MKSGSICPPLRQGSERAFGALPKPEEVFSEDPAKLLEEWKQLFGLRDAAMVKLEEARQEKRIGKGLEAEIEVRVQGHQLEILSKYASSLKEILNVSKVTVIEDTTQTVTALPATGTSAPAAGTSCPRYRTTASGRTSAPLPRGSHRNAHCTARSPRPPFEPSFSAPPALAPAHLGGGHLSGSPDQDWSRCIFPWGRHPGGAARTAHHPLAQRGRAFSLFADSASPHTVRWH